MIGFAVVFGLLAVFIAQVWLNNQANMRAKNLDANRPQMASQTVVVAKQALRFGTELNGSMLQEVPWPSNGLPSGAYAKIQDIVSGGRRGRRNCKICPKQYPSPGRELSQGQGYSIAHRILGAFNSIRLPDWWWRKLLDCE